MAKINELTKKFLKDVHLGDLIKMEFAYGEKRYHDEGYVIELNPWWVRLSRRDPLKNEPEFRKFKDSTRELYYDPLVGYKKLNESEKKEALERFDILN